MVYARYNSCISSFPTSRVAQIHYRAILGRWMYSMRLCIGMLSLERGRSSLRISEDHNQKHRGHDQARSRADESNVGSREASRESDLIMAGYESSLITAGASSSQGSGVSFKRRQAAIYCLDDHALHQLISLSRTCYDDERY